MLAALLPVCVRVFAGQPASLSRADDSVYGTASRCEALELSPLTPVRHANMYVRMRQVRNPIAKARGLRNGERNVRF